MGRLEEALGIEPCEHEGDYDDYRGTLIPDCRGVGNPFYGKKHTDEWRKATRNRMMGNKHTAGHKYKREYVEQRASKIRRPVMIDGVTYNSGKEAAKALGVCPATIVLWKKKGRAIGG